MPFIGQDWRAPGDAWIKINDGSWAQMKLLTNRNSSDIGVILDSRSSPRVRHESGSSISDEINLCDEFERVNSGSEEDIELTEEPKCQPHCFVKTGKSKEFVGCTSMSEAFCKLDLYHAVADVQQFNYICKLVQILVRDKLLDLSGTARKALVTLVESIVCHSLESDCQLTTARDLVSDFMAGLASHSPSHHCGSPKLLLQHQDSVGTLTQLLTDRPIETPAECANEESVTFLDLPQECLRAVLHRLADHNSLLTAAQAHQALDRLVNVENNMWKDLCRFHFSALQIEGICAKLKRRSSTPLNTSQALNLPLAITIDERNNVEIPSADPPTNWRHAYFELKKFFGLREVYADMIHICCHCKALFWKNLGHPCVSGDTAPSVRVTPQQFVEMLMWY